MENAETSAVQPSPPFRITVYPDSVSIGFLGSIPDFYHEFGLDRSGLDAFRSMIDGAVNILGTIDILREGKL